MKNNKGLRRRLVVAVALVAVVGLGSRPSALAFKPRWHKAIAWSALSFVDPKYRAEIAAEQDEMDGNIWSYAGVDKWHFNDCDFSGASLNLVAVYREILAALKEKNPDQAAKLFGRVLHVVQDFYAHTNWIDLKAPGEDKVTALVDTNDGPWSEIVPWTPVAGRFVAVSDTHDRPKNLSIVAAKPPHADAIRVRIDGKEYPALISGEATGHMHCPREATIGHWESSDALNKGLAKDYPCRLPPGGFNAACTLALRQTYQEWCRLRKLASDDDVARQTLQSMVKETQLEMKICREKEFLTQGFSGSCFSGSGK